MRTKNVNENAFFYGLIHRSAQLMVFKLCTIWCQKQERSRNDLSLMIGIKRAYECDNNYFRFELQT